MNGKGGKSVSLCELVRPCVCECECVWWTQQQEGVVKVREGEGCRYKAHVGKLLRHKFQSARGAV